MQGIRFHLRLREERERLKLSQKAVADACGVSLSAYKGWEKTRSMPADLVDKLDELGFDTYYLVMARRLPNLAEAMEQKTLQAHAKIDQAGNGAASPRSETNAGPLRAPDRKMIEQVVASMLRKMQSRGINPPPDMFAKLVMMGYDLVVEGDGENADSVVDKFAKLIK